MIDFTGDNQPVPDGTLVRVENYSGTLDVHSNTYSWGGWVRSFEILAPSGWFEIVGDLNPVHRGVWVEINNDNAGSLYKKIDVSENISWSNIPDGSEFRVIPRPVQIGVPVNCESQEESNMDLSDFDDRDFIHWVYLRMKDIHMESEKFDYMIRFKEIVNNFGKKEIKFNSDDSFVVVTDRDTYSPLDSNGAICMEADLSKSGINDVIKKAKKIGNIFGERLICRLEPIGSIEECQDIIKRD